MPTANFEIRVADFSNEHFALSVIAAPRLTPELARKSFPIPSTIWYASPVPICRSPSAAKIRCCGRLVHPPIWTFRRSVNSYSGFSSGTTRIRSCIASWEHFAELPEHARCLRLCLANQVPALPWEALRDPYKLNGSLARRFSVVRYIPTSPPIQPLDIGTEPLRMLVVFADPDGDLRKSICNPTRAGGHSGSPGRRHSARGAEHRLRGGWHGFNPRSHQGEGRRSHVSHPALFRSRQQRRTRTGFSSKAPGPLRRRLRAGRISIRHWGPPCRVCAWSSSTPVSLRSRVKGWSDTPLSRTWRRAS